MESFYGGRPGYGFILRGSFTSKKSIADAAEDGTLVFGDYAMVGGSNPQVPNYGELFRVNEKKGIDYIGKFLAPALQVDVSVRQMSDATKSEMGFSNDGKPYMYSKQDGDIVYLGFDLPELELGVTKSFSGANNPHYDLSCSDNSSKPYTKELTLTYPPIVKIQQKDSTINANDIVLIWEEE